MQYTYTGRTFMYTYTQKYGRVKKIKILVLYYNTIHATGVFIYTFFSITNNINFLHTIWVPEALIQFTSGALVWGLV